MRVSIVIAVHNEREHLEKTIASCVAGCATLDHEIIVADDASNDLDEKDLIQQFPGIRVSSSRERLGPSPTKHRGATIATGEILLFLDAHCAAEPDALARLVEAVESGPEDAIIIPTVAALDTETWTTKQNRQGHGYVIALDTFHGQWISLRQMKSVEIEGRALYESPSLMGCALAIRKTLYETLDGFDPDMRFWGIEDVDLALRCWMLGGCVLHDPQAIIGHRFQPSFLNYSAPREHIVANQMRMARKHLSEAVWKDWLQRCQTRLAGLGADSQGLYEAAWAIFSEHRESVEEQRAYVLGSRVRDEFWYAERFGLSWPAKKSATSQQPELGGFPAAQRFIAAAFAPSPPPEPPRGASSVQTVTSTNYVPVTQFAVSQRMASYQTSAWVTQVAEISNALSKVTLSGWGGPSLAPSYGGAYQASKRSSSGGGRSYVTELSSQVSRRKLVNPPKTKAIVAEMTTFTVTWNQAPSPGSIGGGWRDVFRAFQQRAGQMLNATQERVDEILARHPSLAQDIREVFDRYKREFSYREKNRWAWTALSLTDWLSRQIKKDPNMTQTLRGVIDLLLKELSQNNSAQSGASSLSSNQCRRSDGSSPLGCANEAPVDKVVRGEGPYDGRVLTDPTGDCRLRYEGSEIYGGCFIDVYRVVATGERVWFELGPINTALA